MLIEIKHRFNNNAIFSHYCDNNTVKLTLEIAIELKVNLSGTYLSWANLSGANLSWANLSGTDLSDATGNNSIIKTIQTGEYIINYTKEIMQIGCKNYSITEWFNFTDDEINDMDGKKALDFWNKWKPILKQIMEI
jgi:uncharacterized protein YjbI with pentapeptide repeats